MLLVKEAVQKYTLFAESPNFLRVFLRTMTYRPLTDYHNIYKKILVSGKSCRRQHTMLNPRRMKCVVGY